MLFSGDQPQPLGVEHLLERLEGEVAKQGAALAEAREALGRLREDAASRQCAESAAGWCEATSHEAAACAQELSEESKLGEWGMRECATLRERVYSLEELGFEAKEQCLGEEIAAEAQSEFHEAQRVRLDMTQEKLAQKQRVWLEEARNWRGFVVDSQRGQERLRAEIHATEEEEESFEIAASAAAAQRWPGASDVESRLVRWSRRIEEQRAQIRTETVAVEHLEERRPQPRSEAGSGATGSSCRTGGGSNAGAPTANGTTLWYEGSVGSLGVPLWLSHCTAQGRTAANGSTSLRSA